MEDMSKGRAKYLKGMELLAEGMSSEEVAKALGLRDAKAWYSMKAYHGNKRLAERAKAEAVARDTPTPAAILEGIDCERSAPRAADAGGKRQALPRKPEAEKLPEDARYWPTEAVKAVEAAAPRMAIRQTLSAQGASVRYRIEGGVVMINAPGQKKGALQLCPDECRVMMAERARRASPIHSAQVVLPRNQRVMVIHLMQVRVQLVQALRILTL